MLILPQLPTQFYGKPEFIQISASWILRLRIKIVEKYLKSPTKCRKFLILGPFRTDPFIAADACRAEVKHRRVSRLNYLRKFERTHVRCLINKRAPARRPNCPAAAVS
jgi:hypothetical protein